jgi:aminopeptidase 2
VNRLSSRRSPLSQVSKRYCSYRRMCRHTGVPSGSTNINHGREVLPTNVKPLHYDLTLEPNFESFTYDGTVIIEYVPFQYASIRDRS